MPIRTLSLSRAHVARIRATVTEQLPAFVQAAAMNDTVNAATNDTANNAAGPAAVLDVDALVRVVTDLTDRIADEHARAHTATALAELAADLDALPAAQLDWSMEQTLGWTHATETDVARLRAAAAELTAEVTTPPPAPPRPARRPGQSGRRADRTRGAS